MPPGRRRYKKRIALDVEGTIPSGESWHRVLLEGSASPGPRRRAVISRELSERLEEYLEFRHFFPHAYTFDLRWEKMRPLAIGCDETLRQLQAELDSFLRGPD